MKTFIDYLNEAGSAPPMPPDTSGSPDGAGLPGAMPSLGGGGLGGMGGGGLGGPSPMGGGLGGGMGGGMDGSKPVPPKKISISDVWEELDKASKDMEKYDQLNIKYLKGKSN